MLELGKKYKKIRWKWNIDMTDNTNERIPLDLLVVLIWTITTFVFVIFENNIMRVILGIPFVLFIPGYVMISTLFPNKDDIDIIERIALSFGLSIAVVPLLGLMLNFTFGIKLIPILTTLSLYTLLMIFGAIYRREKLPEQERFSIHFLDIYDNIIFKIKNKKDNKIDMLTGILILTIILAIGMIIFALTTPKIGERFTEFYILDDNGKADKYQTNLKTYYPVTYLVGVANHEYGTTNYTVKAMLDQNILEYQELILNHDEKWEGNITLVPNKEGDNMKLEFLLFKEDNIEPYRKLHLWVNSSK